MHNDYSGIETSYQDENTMQWTSMEMINNAPKFVLFYSNNCPQCEMMHQEWINLADHAKQDGAQLNVVAINRESNRELMHGCGII